MLIVRLRASVRRKDTGVRVMPAQPGCGLGAVRPAVLTGIRLLGKMGPLGETGLGLLRLPPFTSSG